MQGFLPELLPAARLRVAARACTVAALCVAFSLLVTLLFCKKFGVPDTRSSYFIAGLIPLALSLPISLWLFTRLEQLHQAYRQLDSIASIDWLTQCLNRRAFQAAMPSDSAAGMRGLLVVDVDRFKDINDRFGHESGDNALCLIAETIRSAVGPQDRVGRLGGDEFGVLLENADPDSALRTADLIRQVVSEIILRPAADHPRLSVSIGIAVAARHTPFEDMFRIADQRLLEAKRAGRDRTLI